MDLSDVRKNIDRVDGEIRRLFVERMTLADQVACIKAKTEDKIYKPDREEVIIKKQTEGMKPELVREYTALIKRIMEVSRKYQYGRTLELRQCFPFEYTKVPAVILKPAMVREELYTCEDYSKDKVITVASYEEVADYIKEGKAAAVLLRKLESEYQMNFIICLQRKSCISRIVKCRKTGACAVRSLLL